MTAAAVAAAASLARLEEQAARTVALLAAAGASASSSVVPPSGPHTHAVAAAPRLPATLVPPPLRPLFLALCAEETAVAPAGADPYQVFARAGVLCGKGYGANWAALLVLATVVERSSPRPFPMARRGKSSLLGASGKETLTRGDHSVASLFYLERRSWYSVLITKRASDTEHGTMLCTLARHYWVAPDQQRAMELLGAATSLLR